MKEPAVEIGGKLVREEAKFIPAKMMKVQHMIGCCLFTNE
ncbi:hypothetical protein J2S17_004091 [Cytobacillus purgationiresistens]|uniref:Uncharacterized protein n=1 Tax=Cytobacillus purgationiresistens TaxID=863449 RepID=A0ABU0ALQ7_9BACI|nr:hypothetical protein [Cytobacillus purgationiresistens]